MSKTKYNPIKLLGNYTGSNYGPIRTPFWLLNVIKSDLNNNQIRPKLDKHARFFVLFN